MEPSELEKEQSGCRKMTMKSEWEGMRNLLQIKYI